MTIVEMVAQSAPVVGGSRALREAAQRDVTPVRWKPH